MILKIIGLQIKAPTLLRKIENLPVIKLRVKIIDINSLKISLLIADNIRGE